MQQVESIRSELELILSSPGFAGSKRCQEFLRLSVEHTLRGEFDELRERMIGVEMFGRQVDYDTSNDAVVRVRATEVRKRLAQYYADLESRPAVRIELPAGSYTPKFSWAGSDRIRLVVPADESGAKTAALSQRDEFQSIQTRPYVTKLILSLVTGMCITALAAIAYFSRERWLPSGSRVQSIVVLPLQNLSGDPKQDYFADAMTEELTTDQLSALRVTSRTSAMTYKDARKSLSEIARELRVDGVVEGSVVREGNEAKITAQLIDAKTDRHIWAGTYTRDGPCSRGATGSCSGNRRRSSN